MPWLAIAVLLDVMPPAAVMAGHPSPGLPAIARPAHPNARLEPDGAAPAGAYVWLQPSVEAGVERVELPAAVAEAARIWLPYGYRVAVRQDASPRIGAGDVVLRVDITRRGPERVPDSHDQPAIGWIEFRSDHHPIDVVHLSVGRLERLLDRANLGTRRVDALPGLVRRRLSGLVLGRSLAHEIGHYLLASTQHTARGLMRPRFDGPELFGDRIDGFRLEAGQISRLTALGADRARDGALASATTPDGSATP